ncbi:hypothetical protein [Streptomyces sp. ISL-100]|uniref:hypothetical protein n=1 Tax=Streptomyces sp. ISL-100 TaxID=2819173 RepID=UPI001BEA11F2|nr:hypothetical protein [Streptomyces sp. ISL-100]MBT2398245.1 hypothetical protein [Streptomyces sp. ISL-100]
MTKASPLLTPGPHPISAKNTTRTVRMGKWVFTPTAGHPIWGTHATLHDNDRCIALRYSACLLENLLAQLGSIENQFANAFTGPGTGQEHTGRPNGRAVRG